MSQQKRKGSASRSPNRTRGQVAPSAASSANDDDEEEGCSQSKRQRRGQPPRWKPNPMTDELEDNCQAKVAWRHSTMTKSTRTIPSRSHRQQVWGTFARGAPGRRRNERRAHRSQPLAASLVFITVSLIHLGAAASAAQLTQPAGANPERLQANLLPAPQAPNANATAPRRTPPRPAPKLEEQEVDLLRPARQPARASPGGRKPRIFRLRADNSNGRLSLPLRLNINDRLLSIPVERQLAAVPLEFQLNRTIASAATTRLPAAAPTTTTSSSQPSARGEQREFGARGLPSQQLRASQQPAEPQRQPAPASKPAGANQTLEDCAPSDGRDQGSISMSSPMLRLLPNAAGSSGIVGRATPVGSRRGSAGAAAAPEGALQPGQQRGRHRAVAAGNSAIEVEEQESPATSARGASQQAQLGELQSASSRTASRSSSGRPVAASRQDEGGLHQVAAGLRVAGDELSFAGPPATSGAEPGASGESSPGPPESILSLIDEYDSKIITNRTKAQLSCDSGEMILRLNFSEPYKGIVYPDHDRLSPCRFFGDGHHNYELRLPLRGCGTRQAAPRVFVNDVIVRFHKTLELEEDEVKTLICRYPPPLASSTPLEQGGGGGGVSFAGNRPTATSGSAGGNKLEQESPSSSFEFIEPTGGRSPRPEPGSSGNIETLSENLIVAPASGIKLSGAPIGAQGGAGGASSAFMTPPYAGGRAPGANQQPQLPADLFDQRNSILGEAPPAGAGPNFFERLSSVELLMLISSLMFLILLAIGLASSYLCFRRRARRTRHGQRASSILKSGKQRRYLGPGAIGQVVTTTAAAGRRTAQPPSSFSHGQQRQHYQVAPGQPPQHYQRGQQPASTTAPSSPDSDLSARGLLASDLASQQQQQYQAHPPASSYVYRNAAYVPDQPQAGFERVPGAVAAAGVGGAVYAAVPFALAPGAKAPTSAGRKQQQQPAGLAGPVLGRRDTVYGYSAFGQTPVRRAGFGGQHAMASKQPRQVVAPEMWRPKSLSSVQEQQQQQQILQPGEHRTSAGWKLPPAQLIDGTLGRRELAAREEQARRRHSQRHRYYAGDRSQDESADEQERDEGRHRVSGIRIPPLKFAGAQPAADQKPAQTRILLKSIEDSYITNYTEIEEQEYIRSNSTRRISLDQWRAMQPAGGAGNQTEGQRRPPAAGARLIGSSDSDASEPASSRAGDQQRSTGTNRNQANLRSLTELDVNFAKSLLMPVSQFNTSSSGGQQQRSPSASGALSDGEHRNRTDHDRGGGHDHDLGLSTAQRRRSRSVTELAADTTAQNSHQREQTAQRRAQREAGATGGPATRASRRQLQSPDLILSPEYDLDRLALESPLSSHNSVSYV